MSLFDVTIGKNSYCLCSVVPQTQTKYIVDYAHGTLGTKVMCLSRDDNLSNVFDEPDACMVRIPAGEILSSCPDHPGCHSGFNSVPIQLISEVLSLGPGDRGMKLTAEHHLVSRLRMSGV